MPRAAKKTAVVLDIHFHAFGEGIIREDASTSLERYEKK